MLGLTSLYVFAHLTPVASFPTLGKQFHAFPRLASVYIFLRFTPVAFFPALGIRYKFLLQVSDWFIA